MANTYRVEGLLMELRGKVPFCSFRWVVEPHYVVEERRWVAVAEETDDGPIWKEEVTYGTDS